MRQIGWGLFWLVIFSGAALPVSMAVIGWMIGRDDFINRAREVAQVSAPLLTFVGFVVAAFVAYNTWLSPFSVALEFRPFVWRLGPGTPPPGGLNVVSYITVFNRGATPGAISDLLVEIDLPRGKWVLEPHFFVRPAEFYRTAFQPEVKIPFDVELIDGPFMPIYLPGRAQVSKAVSFGPGFGAGEFDPALLEAGVHPIRMYARYNLTDTLTKVMDAKIVFEADLLAQLKAGMTVAGEVRHRDTNVKELKKN